MKLLPNLPQLAPSGAVRLHRDVPFPDMNFISLCSVMARDITAKDTKGVRCGGRPSFGGIRRCFISS